MSWGDWVLVAVVCIGVPLFWITVGVLVGRFITRRSRRR